MGLIDRARTQYKSLPGPVRVFVGSLANLVPEKFRYGRRYADMRAALNATRSDAEVALSRQHDLLRTQLARAAAQSPHYHEVCTRAGVDPTAPAIMAEIAKLPILTKEQVRAAPETLLTRPASELDLVTTSGSSGTPLKFYLDRERSVVEWAFLLDAWAQIGFRPSKKRAALRGFEIPDVDSQPWEYEPGLRELRLSPFHMNAKWLPRYIDEISRRGITFLHGYPSAIEILARHVEREGQAGFGASIRGIILTSEAFYPHQAALFAKVFPQAKILSFYGLSEKALFATSDPQDPALFWFNPLYGLAELVDAEGAAVTEPGASGRLVGTGLQFSGMPFIRYDTGDMAELAALPGPENGYRMGVRNITSRWGQEFLVGGGGEMISTTALNIHSEAYASMRTFMISQTVPGKATVQAVLAPGKEASAVEDFVAEIGRKTGGNLTFDLEIVDDIPAGARGKRNWIRQSLDVMGLRDGGSR